MSALAEKVLELQVALKDSVTVTDQLRREIVAVEERHQTLVSWLRRVEDTFLKKHSARLSALLNCDAAGAPPPRGQHVLTALRRDELLILRGSGSEIASVSGCDPFDAIDAVMSGQCKHCWIVSSAEGVAPIEGRELLDAIRDEPLAALAWFRAFLPEHSPHDAEFRSNGHFNKLAQIIKHINCIDFHAIEEKRFVDNIGIFRYPENTPKFAKVPAQIRSNTVVFLNNSYHHFNNLSRELRKRGWTALTVSTNPPDSQSSLFFQGEDLNLFHPDVAEMNRGIAAFLRTVPEKFGSLHFYEIGKPSFFPDLADFGAPPTLVPWDFLELRRHQTLIGYTASGCLDGARQSSIKSIAGLCGHCAWENRADVCNEDRSMAWKTTLEMICDWISLECDLTTPERIGPKYVYGPVTSCLDADLWRPDIAIPEDMRITRQPGETIVYHAFGNFEQRTRGDRDIKGTEAILEAVERLKAEGFRINMQFVRKVPSAKVRFLQVQADIVIDQLHYGRFGANARESLMLGRPVIGRIDARQAAPLAPLPAVIECPIVDATTETIYQTLKGLISDPARRERLSAESRAYALRWFGSEACAGRFEAISRRLRNGLPPEAPEIYDPETRPRPN